MAMVRIAGNQCGLPIVPFVPWHGAPAVGGPRDRLLTCFIKKLYKKS